MTAEAKRDEALKALQQEIDDEEFPPSSSTSYHSWVRGNCTLETTSSSSSSDNNNNNELSSSSSYYPTDRCRFFDKHGFIFLPQFSTHDEVQSMKSSMEEMVNNDWKPSSSTKTQVFRTDLKQVEAQGHSDYFLDSASKTHFFAEKDAIHEDTGELKEEYLHLGQQQQNNNKNKLAALNKVGHGMHTTPGSPFQSYTQSSKIAKLLRELGWVDPVVPQSMYIFKQARIGGEVTSHQDSTFLYTTPRQTCIGLWLALDDATLDNGCLWIRPKSHRESVRRQFVRNVEHFGKSLNYDDVDDDDDNNDDEGGKDGDSTKPQMTFRNLRNDNNDEEQQHDDDHVTWEGALPKDSLPTPECVGLHRAGFVPVPCKAGDLLAFVGELDHLSLPNFSNTPRHTFQLHCIEGEGAGVEWSKENWLQYPPGVPFMKL